MNKRLLGFAVMAMLLLVPSVAFAAAPAAAAAAGAGSSAISIDMSGGMFTDRMVQIIALITILSLAPSILIMMTSFVRIVVVLSLLRTAIGVQPMIAGTMTTEDAMTKAMVPMKKFMLAHVRDADLKLFLDMRKTPVPKDPLQVDVTTLAPAFMLSELKRAFEIGFLIFVPFLIIDMAVASILMSMGMMMLPPTIISLPFKLIFFVLVDGWRLIAGSLVQSYMHSPPPT